MQKVDAIMNAAKSSLVIGGPVAHANRKRSGREIKAEAAAQGPIVVSEVLATGAGTLPAKHVGMPI